MAVYDPNQPHHLRYVRDGDPLDPDLKKKLERDVLALFIDSPAISQNYSNPQLIWLVCPLVLYLLMRIWILARRGEMNDDPVVFLMTDWRSQIMIVAGALVMLVSQLVVT